MPRIRIVGVGQTKEPWLELALAEYEKRLRAHLAVEWIWTRGDDQLIRLLEKERLVICLDPQGQQMTSETFASFLQKKLEESGAVVTWVIGGPCGLPPILRARHPLVSLSALTLTHQCVRLLLIEQIYRATEIWRGSPYHK